MKNYLSYFREGVWIAFGQALVALGALVGVRLLTEVLSPVAYGEVALGTTIATLVNQTVFGPLGNGIARFYAPATEENEFPHFMSASLLLVKKCIFAIVAIVTMVSLTLCASGYSRFLGIVLAFAAFAVLSGANSILNGLQNAARQRKTVAIFQAADVWSRFLISAALIWLLQSNSTVAACGYAMSGLLIVSLQYLVFRRTRDLSVVHHDQGKWMRKIWDFSWPFASWGIFTWARLASDRWSLQIFSSKEEVGYYSVVFQLGYYPMSLLTGMVTQLFAPILYQRAGNAKDVRRNADAHGLSFKLTMFALLLTACAFVVAELFHAELFRILAARQYAKVSYLLPWVILSGGVFAAAQLIGLNIMSRLQVNALILCTIATAIAGIGLNFVGVYLYGLDGAVGAGLVFAIMYFVWIYILNKKLADSNKAANADAAALA